MKFDIKVSPKARKFLESCPEELKFRLKERISFMSNNPFYFLERLAGKDFYKFRIGDYRAIVDVDFHNKIIFIRVLDHRKRIYKKL